MNPQAEAFRRHGLWSPGVRLFKRLNFASKAGLISAMFLVVVLQFAWIFIDASNEAIDASKRELQGLLHVQALMQLQGDALELRRLSLSKGPAAGEAWRRQMEQVQGRLQALDALDARSLGLEKARQFLHDAYTPLAKPATDPETAFRQADDFVMQLMRMMATVADNSNLVLDPEAGTYHLMVATTRETLDVRNRLGRLRDLGADALRSGGPLSDTNRTMLQGDSYVLYGVLEALFTLYERVVADRPELAQPLSFEEHFKPINAFMRAVRKGPLASDGPAGDTAAYERVGEAAIQSLAGLADRSRTELGTLIEARVQRLQTRRNLQLAMAASGLLVAAYLFYCFYRVTMGGLREVRRHIDAMARGDLTTQPQPWGRDEAADLTLGIAQMQASLRLLVGEVRRCADDIVVDSGQVSGGAGDLAERTEKSAASLQQTAAAMEQIAATVRTAAQRTDESARLGRENAQVAAVGGEVVSQVVSTMQEIERASTRIADITGVIDGIAFQTNILALNAAVEAARAGEQGRGFAVVAAEVRTLAQRSAAAAREIKSVVTASAAQTSQGAGVAGRAGETMARVVQNALAMSGLLAEVSTAAAEQTRGVAEVTGSVAELDRDTKRNAALVTETSAAAQQMKQRALALASAADRFRLPEAEGSAT